MLAMVTALTLLTLLTILTMAANVNVREIFIADTRSRAAAAA